MFLGPTTLVLILAVLACLISGAVLIRRALVGRGGRASRICTRCRNANTGSAIFCAQCGAPLR